MERFLSFNIFVLVPMCVTISQFCDLWFLLQSQHNMPAFFLDSVVPVNKDKAVKKLGFRFDKKGFSQTIKSSLKIYCE